jgi:hypothetical protein
MTKTNRTPIPENFTPATNQLAVVDDGFERYYGSFTGRQCKDGSWQVFYKNICGDNCWASTNDEGIKVTLD